MVRHHTTEEGLPPLRERRLAAFERQAEAARSHPLVKAALDTFPDARIEDIRDMAKQSDKTKS